MSNRTLYRAFGDAAAYLDDVYTFYCEKYDLPLLKATIALDDKALFNYCKARRYFVNILPYTLDEQVLLSPAFSGDDLAWRIIGGAVKDSFENDFVSVSTEHVRRYVPEVDLGEIEPVAFLQNDFVFQEQAHSHRGILFIARIRNYDNRRLRESLSASRGHFVPVGSHIVSIGTLSSRPKLPQIYQSAAFESAVNRIATAVKYVTQDAEIDTNLQYRARYEFHDWIGKPIMRILSRMIGRHTLHQLDSRIEEELLANDARTVLDVACGENLGLVKLVHSGKLEVFVGNDISWSQVRLIAGSLSPAALRDTEGMILFTNHDARRLPFRDKAFHTVICKNVLHHMPDRSSVQGLIGELCRVGRRALVVEVMDPVFEGFWGRLRHRYYIDFLKDAGGHFLSREEFSRLVHPFGPKATYEMSTFRGVYQFAIMESE